MSTSPICPDGSGGEHLSAIDEGPTIGLWTSDNSANWARIQDRAKSGDPKRLAAQGVTRREFLTGAAALPLVALGKSNNVPTVPPKRTPTTAVGSVTGVTGLGRAKFVQHGTIGSSHFALTFHGAGDTALSEAALAILKKLRAPITVFAVGNWAAANPTLMATFLRDGHELANHTLTHPSLRRLNRSKVAIEISGCAEALKHATGAIGSWFRPSGTPTPTTLILEEALKAGYQTVVGYSVDPSDYQDPGTKAVVARTLKGLTGGSIVSLHLGHKGTVDALEQIILGGRSSGLEPVTVTKLLSV
jgi:peptidoglycan/xylan/chitin deacetylase (PgdA/CDA1 family)